MTVSSDLVSAIITTHNRIELLKRAIESVLSQTYQNIECIVVDDSSDDGTEEYCGKLDNIVYIRISKNESRGGNYARNLGIKASKGEFIAFLDDDDYWLSEKIEKQVNLLKEKLCSLVFCGRKLEYVKKNAEIFYRDDLPNSKYKGDLSTEILMSICTTTSAIFVKRDVLFEVGLFDENLKFWQEYELSIRLAQKTFFYFVNEPLVVYRVDLNDSQRLTNKYYAWMEAVDYIKGKHHKLYNRLTFFQRVRCKRLISNDAVVRCKNSGMLCRSVFYRIFSLFLKCILIFDFQ